MELKEDLKAGDEITIQIAPFGEYPAETVGGTQLVEVFDREGFEKIIETWKQDGGKLIRADFDHASEITDSTVASGWLKDLHIDDERGLMGTLVVSESGASALNGLDYRFGSPTLILDDSGRPVQLVSFALTNRPRLDNMDAVYNMAETKTPSIVNRNDEENSGKGEVKEKDNSPDAEKAEEEPKAEMVNNTEEEKNMDELKSILGLPPEATDEDVKNSVKEMVDKLKAIADEEIAEEAEEAVNECGVEEDKKEEVVNCYKQNPALVKSVLNCFKKQPAKMVCNAQKAVKPELTDAEKLKREYAALKGGKDKVDFLKAHPSMKL